jgi:adenosyl cobinamide kinase/adenosyl cobinamide phosphate guanylyltransferase
MRTQSPLEIAERTVETYPFEGEWKLLFGEPDIRFSTLIQGEAKSGKSTYAAKFAQYIGENFGRALYISAEERLNSKTLQNRLKLCNVTSTNVRFIHCKNIEEIEACIKSGKFRFVIMDSVQHVQMTYNQFEAMRHRFKKRKLSWHLIMQMGVDVTKWKHEVDVLVMVKNGRAYIKGRYSESNSMQVLSSSTGQQQINF